jgi:hypothetical protein
MNLDAFIATLPNSLDLPASEVRASRQTHGQTHSLFFFLDENFKKKVERYFYHQSDLI